MNTKATIDTNDLSLAAMPAGSGPVQLTEDELDAVSGGIWPLVVVGAFVAGYLVGKLS